MDAIFKRFGVLCALCLSTTLAHAATHKTTNFVVTATNADTARRVANCAEYWRRDLAVQWLGKPLPNWYQPCPISVREDLPGAGGQTTFTFENGEVYGWKMQVQGTLERILDSVIPHEVNHTIFASYFRRPLPRWADEGAATLFEHKSEQARQMHLLNRVLNTNKRIPLQELLTIREYPPDMQDVLTLYAEGYSLAGFLVGSKGEDGRKVYLKFLEDAHKMGWDKAIQKHYGYDSIALLEKQWTKWVVAGSPPLIPAGSSLAQADSEVETPVEAIRVASASAEETVIRSQSPSENETVSATVPALAEVTRDPSPLPGISRQLRVARQTDNDHEASELQSRPQPENSVSVNAGDFRPRVIRHSANGTTSPAARLSPTADGITTDPNSRSYSFPAARE